MNNDGIGKARGVYQTKSNVRKYNEEYKKKHDIIRMQLPLEYRDQIKATGMRPIDFYNEAIKHALKGSDKGETR